MNIPEAATFADALDGLGAGLFLVDKTGRIIHANASGHAMLRERSVLREGDGRLVPCEVHAATALKELFAIVAGGDGVFGAKPIALPLSTRDGNHYLAHILPLTSAPRRCAPRVPLVPPSQPSSCTRRRSRLPHQLMSLPSSTI